MAIPKFTYQRGEAIMLDLIVNSAGSYTPSALTLTMSLKRASAGQVPPRAAPVVKTFDVAFVAASGDQPAYWRGTIPASEAAGMSGLYVTDAQIMNGSDVLDVTTPALINIAESVTPA